MICPGIEIRFRAKGSNKYPFTWFAAFSLVNRDAAMTFARAMISIYRARDPDSEFAIFEDDIMIQDGSGNSVGA